MSYESAPATEMLATNCACCGRPLVDAKSVEAGVGPKCRKRHGYDIDVPEEARSEANRLIYEIALHQEGPDLLSNVARLRELGFEKLADRVIRRLKPISIEELDGGRRMAVKTPYVVASLDAWRGIPGRRWDKKLRANTVPASQRPAVWSLLKRFFAGDTGIGPKGTFAIPFGHATCSEPEPQPEPVQRDLLDAMSGA